MTFPNNQNIGAIDLLKKYFMNNIDRDIIGCVDAYYNHNDKLHIYYKTEAIGDIKAFGVYVKTDYIKSKIARIAEDALKYINNKAYYPKILKVFADYLHIKY